jgi:mono/diheme cytochrome c family protein
MRQFLLGLVIGVAILPVTIFIAGSFGWLATNSTATPPAWETSFARHALHAAAASHAPRLHNPVMVNDSTLRAGMKFFRDQCAGCHGTPGREEPVGLYPEPPKFASHSPTLPDWQMFWIVEKGVRYSGMFAWRGQGVDDEKIWTVVTFLHHLDSLPPDIAAEWRKR